ncbi:morphogenic membrane protein MmpB [Embleya sp. NPDC055664]
MRNRDEFSEETRRAVAQLRRALWVLPLVLILGLALLAL